MRRRKGRESRSWSREKRRTRSNEVKGISIKPLLKFSPNLAGTLKIIYYRANIFLVIFL